MCGICGIVALDNRRLEEEHLDAMSRVLRHRGPDDQGQYLSGPVGLGFRRLSIIDVAGGHQPMCNEDGTIWIVFNGEIYNHLELRPILEQRGHRYATNSDTETIVHLYEEYGEDSVHHLRGMFAFAIWDKSRQAIFCARDRLGIKPFYYVVDDGCFAFASEIKALLALPSFRARLNRQALPEVLAFGYLSSDETLFSGVRKLMPGHCLRVDLGKDRRAPTITKYWDLNVSAPEQELTETEYVDRFSQLFRTTVESHLMSDVPLGVFLSGGLDSSSIAAEVAGLRSDRIQTFAVGYAEDQYSELPYARLVAKHIRADHHEVVLTPQEFLAALPHLIWHEDEPLVWPSSVALYYVSRLASDRVKVVLTGEGSDEILAGYLKYRLTLWNMRWAPAYKKLAPQLLQEALRRALKSESIPDWLRRKLCHSFLYHPNTFERLYFDNFYSSFPKSEQRQVFTHEVAGELRDSDPYANSMSFFKTEGSPETLLSRLLYLDIKTYLVELLMKQDQMSMATSIESRVPFLDHKLVEWIARVPARYKARAFSGKYLLRRAMANRLPSEILTRSKKGFPTPIRPWLRKQLASHLTAVLTDGRMEERGLFRPEYVKQLLAGHQHGNAHATEGCWRLLNLELWSRIFLDRDRALLGSCAPEAMAAPSAA